MSGFVLFSKNYNLEHAFSRRKEDPIGYITSFWSDDRVLQKDLRIFHSRYEPEHDVVALIERINCVAEPVLGRENTSKFTINIVAHLSAKNKKQATKIFTRVATQPWKPSAYIEFKLYNLAQHSSPEYELEKPGCFKIMFMDIESNPSSNKEHELSSFEISLIPDPDSENIELIHFDEEEPGTRLATNLNQVIANKEVIANKDKLP